MTFNTKTKPSNTDAERQVLGAILTDPRAIDKAAMRLKPEDFYIPKHRAIYDSILDLYTARDAIDQTTVSAKVPSHGATVAELTEGVRDPENIESHIKIVKNLSTRRVILDIATELASLANDKELEEVQSYAKGVITKVLSDPDERSKLLSPSDQVEILRAMIARKRSGEVTGISTGYPRLDKLTGGLRRGDLIVIGARTSVGKSSYAENIAENVAGNGHRVMFVSIEMDPEQIAFRFAKRAGVSDSIIEHGTDDPSSAEALEKFIEQRLQLPLLIHNEPTADTIKIRSMLNQAIAEHGPVDLLVVDYLQLMYDTFGGKVPEHLRLGLITKTLKGMAREYKLPVILISQLNRNSDQRGVLPEPRLSDIRESGRIEEDADLILFLWTIKDQPVGHDTKLKIGKNRQGPTGEVPVRFFKPAFKFSEPTETELEAERAAKELEEITGMIEELGGIVGVDREPKGFPPSGSIESLMGNNPYGIDYLHDDMDTAMNKKFPGRAKMLEEKALRDGVDKGSGERPNPETEEEVTQEEE